MAKIPQKVARTKPKIQNKSLTVSSQIIPSRSRVKIRPGILTKPQLKISATISPTKLLSKIKQEIRVNAKIPKTQQMATFDVTRPITIRATATKPPHTNE